MAVRRRYSGGELLARWTLAVRAQARAQAAIRAATLASIEAAWRQMDDPYDPAGIRAFVLAAADSVARGRTRAADMTVADTRRVLADGGVDLRRSGVSVSPQPRGVPLTQEMLRGPAHARWLLSQGRDIEDAMGGGLSRAEVMATYDLALATRDAFADLAESSPDIVGWNRMIHPELAVSGQTCGLCIAAATRVYGKADLMPLHVSCVPPGTTLSAVGVSALTRRSYTGPLVILATAAGHDLAITPNHPVLTEQGWVPAGLVREGDHLIRDRRRERVGGRGPREHQQPALVEDVWRTAAVESGLHSRPVPLAAEDFHGDGADGEVDVVATDGLLAHVPGVSFVEPRGEPALVSGHLPGPRLPGQGAADQPLFWLRDSTDGLVRRRGQRGPLFRGAARVPVLLGGSQPASFYARLSEADRDHVARDPEFLRELKFGFTEDVAHGDRLEWQGNSSIARFDPAGTEFTGEDRRAYAELGMNLRARLAGEVELDRVIETSRVGFRGHVYNLQTEEGWYSASRVIVSNCHCLPFPVLSGQEDLARRINGQDLEDLYKQVGLTRRQDLQKVRFRVEQHGELGPVLVQQGHSFRGPQDVA